MSYKSVFDASTITTEFQNAGINIRFIPLIWRYILQKPNSVWEDIPSLPAAAYTLLNLKFKPSTSSVHSVLHSSDQVTTKLLIKLQNGAFVEAVIMRYDSRLGRREAVNRSRNGEETLGEIEQLLPHSDTIDFMQTTFVSMNMLRGRMAQKILFFGLLVIIFLIISVAFADDKNLYIWPMPKSVTYGKQTLYLSDKLELKTDGGNYADSSGILNEGFNRLINIITAGHVVSANSSSSKNLIKGIHIVVRSSNDELQHGVDESYNLTIPVQGNPLYAYIEAQTVYGALHGLQTLSQNFYFNINTGVIEVHQAPWSILDQPRFSYRGLLIDTSRHYVTLPALKKVIDSMAYSKLNVLHWHIVDTQSFPLYVPSYPKLWDAAYSSYERYSMADAAEIVRYAQRQGIHVLAEIDVPGHAGSWGVGYPSLWPSVNCTQPLDVSNEFSFQVIDGILSDFSKVFKYKFVHLGGDEVDTSCWTTTSHISEWLQKNGYDASGAYEYFVLRAQKIALSHGYEMINWEETFNHFGSKLNPKTIVHNWLGGGVAPKVVAAGLRCIVSNQDKWYLDHLDANWEGFYLNEPLTNITKPEEQALILGGEVCMWGETIDASDIEQTIWPRAAAAAERLWTTFEKLSNEPKEVASRLSHFRCLLNQRGVAAAPLAGPGRGTPLEPGSCYRQ